MKTTNKVNLPPFIINALAKNSQELEEHKNDEMRNVNWGKKLSGIPLAWQKTMGEDVRVAVLDTGIDSNHPDLKDVIAEVRDFTGDGIEDMSGHGTHCAGVIAGQPIQSEFVGVAPKAELIIGKVLDNKGRGNGKWICEALEWLLEGVKSGSDYAPDIISMSLGGYFRSKKLFKVIHELTALGVHIVIAAGNEGSAYRNSIGAPACYSCGIVVGACDSNGNPSGFSSRGGEIFCLAPGDEIWSTYPGGGYACLSGTSMATPFIAGYAALIVAYHKMNPNTKTPIHNVHDLKLHFFKDLTHPGWHTNNGGYGVLQIFKPFFDVNPFD
ncbi:MAG: S8 family peptidase [Bacteroidota bacterium]